MDIVLRGDALSHIIIRPQLDASVVVAFPATWIYHRGLMPRLPARSSSMGSNTHKHSRQKSEHVREPHSDNTILSQRNGSHGRKTSHTRLKSGDAHYSSPSSLDRPSCGMSWASSRYAKTMPIRIRDHKKETVQLLRRAYHSDSKTRSKSKSIIPRTPGSVEGGCTSAQTFALLKRCTSTMPSCKSNQNVDKLRSQISSGGVANGERNPPTEQKEHVVVHGPDIMPEWRSDAEAVAWQSTMETPPPPLPPPPPPEVLLAASLGLRTSDLLARVTARPWKTTARQQSMSASSDAVTLPPVLRTNIDQRALHSLQYTIAVQEALIEARSAVTSQRIMLKSRLAQRQSILSSLKLRMHVTSERPETLESNLAQERNVLLQEMSETVAVMQELLSIEETTLATVERSCLEQETDCLKELQAMVLQYPTHYRPNSPPSSTAESEIVESIRSFASTTSQAMPAIVQRYLQAIGRVNLLRDRLFNLSSDWRLQMYRHTMDVEEGYGGSDSKLHTEFLKRREAIIAEYRSTRQEIDEVLQICREQRLDIQLPNLPKDIEKVFDEEEAFTKQSGGKYTSRLKSVATRVLQWAHDVRRQSHADQDLELAMINANIEVESPLVPPHHYNPTTIESLSLEEAALSETSAASINAPSRTFIGDIPTAGRRYSAPMILMNSENFVDTAFDYQTAASRAANREGRESRLGICRAMSDA